jgi:hypothetical protein
MWITWFPFANTVSGSNNNGVSLPTTSRWIHFREGWPPRGSSPREGGWSIPLKPTYRVHDDPWGRSIPFHTDLSQSSEIDPLDAMQDEDGHHLKLPNSIRCIQLQDNH